MENRIAQVLQVDFFNFTQQRKPESLLSLCSSAGKMNVGYSSLHLSTEKWCFKSRATQLYTPLCPLVGRSHFTCFTLSFCGLCLASLLLPKCTSDLKHSHHMTKKVEDGEGWVILPRSRHITTRGEKLVLGMNGMTAEETPMRMRATCWRRIRLTQAKSAILPKRTRLMPG